jgi:hypothetical protein
MTPKVFVSYSWDSTDHREWVIKLSERLRSDGIDVTLDHWHAQPGDQLPAFMERAIRDNDFVIVICTRNYKLKADGRLGGVGYEGNIMTAELFTTRNERKFIPVLRQGPWEEAAPSWLKGKYRIELSGDPYSENAYYSIVHHLHGMSPAAPPLGPAPTQPSSPHVKHNSPNTNFDKWINNCNTRLTDLITLISKPSPSESYSKGYWSFAYSLSDVKFKSKKELYDVLQQVDRGINYAPWRAHRKVPDIMKDHIECWLNSDLDCAGYPEFWCSSVSGQFYLARPYDDDLILWRQRTMQFPSLGIPGTQIEAFLFTLRIAACLKHCIKMAQSQLSKQIEIHLQCTGLQNRSLSDWAQQDISFLLPFHPTCQIESVESRISVSVDEITDNLPIIVESLTKPIFEIFDFYEMPLDKIYQLLDRARHH